MNGTYWRAVSQCNSNKTPEIWTDKISPPNRSDFPKRWCFHSNSSLFISSKSGKVVRGSQRTGSDFSRFPHSWTSDSPLNHPQRTDVRPPSPIRIHLPAELKVPPRFYWTEESSGILGWNIGLLIVDFWTSKIKNHQPPFKNDHGCYQPSTGNRKEPNFKPQNHVDRQF